ncbi:MAG: hypothetical protein WC520_03650 [Candidatus Paceibacterota bacterium]
MLFPISVLLAPIFVNAEVVLPPPIDPNIMKILDRVFIFLSNIAFAVVPLMIIWAALIFITAGGNPEKITKARQIILYAVIGLVIILFSRGIIATIQWIIIGPT